MHLVHQLVMASLSLDHRDPAQSIGVFESFTSFPSRAQHPGCCSEDDVVAVEVAVETELEV
jgi:hypothetical protein